MKTETIGDGSPHIAIIGGIHGDEPCGKNVVEYLYENLTDVNGTVKLIIANEPALENQQRYVNIDLNRQFTTNDITDDPQHYEVDLAQKIISEVHGYDLILDIHSTHSEPTPFAIYDTLTPTITKSLHRLPIENTINTGELPRKSLEQLENCLTIEFGPQGTKSATRDATRITLELLREFDILDSDPYYEKSPFNVMVAKGQIEKGESNWTLNYHNFELIDKNSIIAHDSDYTHKAPYDNTTVALASERGYEDIYGIIGYFQSTVSPYRGQEM